jgi:hypothetical protein
LCPCLNFSTPLSFSFILKKKKKKLGSFLLWDIYMQTRDCKT